MKKKKTIIKKPLITIITVVKNDQNKIFNTLKSVFEQTYKNFQYIVIDGNSEDGTLKILNKNKNNIDLQFLKVIKIYGKHWIKEYFIAKEKS